MSDGIVSHTARQHGRVKLTRAGAANLRRDGSRKSLERLLHGHIGAVVAIVNRSCRNIADHRYDDAVQTGLMAAWNAIQTWDPDLGSLSALLNVAVRRKLWTFMGREWGLYRSEDIARRQARAHKTRERLRAMSADDSPEAVGREMGLSAKKAAEVLDLSDVKIVKFSHQGDDGGSPIIDNIPSSNPTPYDYAVAGEMLDAVRSLDARANSYERSILRHRILSDRPETFKQISDRHGCRRQYVEMINRRLATRLRSRIKSAAFYRA